MAKGIVPPGKPDGRKSRARHLTPEMVRQAVQELRDRADEIESLGRQISDDVPLTVDGAARAGQAAQLLRAFAAKFRAALAKREALTW